MPFMPAENIARYVDFMRVLNHNGIPLDLESTTSRDQITATKVSNVNGARKAVHKRATDNVYDRCKVTFEAFSAPEHITV